MGEYLVTVGNPETPLVNDYTVPVLSNILLSFPRLLLLLLHDLPLDLVDAAPHLVERVDQRRPHLPQAGAEVAAEADLHPVHVRVQSTEIERY